MIKGKKGSGWIWIYGLTFLFALGLLYVIFTYVFNTQLIPVVKAAINTTDTDPQLVISSFAAIDKYMVYFRAMPFILFFIVVIYMIASALYKQSGTQY